MIHPPGRILMSHHVAARALRNRPRYRVQMEWTGSGGRAFAFGWFWGSSDTKISWWIVFWSIIPTRHQFMPCWLVGQGHPSEKYELVNWDDYSQYIWENKTCSKPPTSQLMPWRSPRLTMKRWETQRGDRHLVLASRRRITATVDETCKPQQASGMTNLVHGMCNICMYVYIYILYVIVCIYCVCIYIYIYTYYM